MSIITNYYRLIHTCILCLSENVKEEIQHEFMRTDDGKLWCKLIYKYQCLDCKHKWEL